MRFLPGTDAIVLAALLGAAGFSAAEAGSAGDASRAVALAPVPRPVVHVEEPRALWVVRDAMVSARSIDTFVADAKRAGITDLFVQVRGRGDAYYLSELAPPPDALERSWKRHGRFDPLTHAVAAAHAEGIRVHAWINVCLAAGFGFSDARNVTRTHPEWVAVDPRGTPMTHMPESRIRDALTEGAYLDPAEPGAAAHLVAVCRELARNYALDGLHLDYVRYPHMDVGYGEAARSGFRRLHRVDPLERAANRDGFRLERGAPGLARLDRAWSLYRAEKITDLVRGIRMTLREERPGMTLSAAVKPDREGALSRYGQDWVRWVDEDLVDVVAPMMYSPSMATMRKHVAAIASVVPPERVWAGIAVYNQSLDAAAAKIDAARHAGMGGISIFSYNSVPGGGTGLAKLTRSR